MFRFIQTSEGGADEQWCKVGVSNDHDKRLNAIFKGLRSATEGIDIQGPFDVIICKSASNVESSHGSADIIERTMLSMLKIRDCDKRNKSTGSTEMRRLNVECAGSTLTYDKMKAMLSRTLTSLREMNHDIIVEGDLPVEKSQPSVEELIEMMTMLNDKVNVWVKNVKSVDHNVRTLNYRMSALETMSTSVHESVRSTSPSVDEQPHYLRTLHEHFQPYSEIQLHPETPPAQGKKNKSKRCTIM